MVSSFSLNGLYQGKEQRSKTHLKTLHTTSKHKERYGVAIKNILSFTFLGVKLKSYWLTQRHQINVDFPIE